MKLIKALGVAGMIWSVGLGLFGVLLSSSKGMPDPTWVLLAAAMTFVFWQMYRQRRWAGVVACAYAWWTAAGSGLAGIWQWTGGWVAVAVVLTLAVISSWGDLLPGDSAAAG